MTGVSLPCDCEPSFPALVHLDVLYCGEYTSLKGLRHYITISVVLLYYKSNDKKTLLHHHFIIWMRKNQFLDILQNVKSHIEKLLKVKMLLVLKF